MSGTGTGGAAAGSGGASGTGGANGGPTGSGGSGATGSGGTTDGTGGMTSGTGGAGMAGAAGTGAGGMGPSGACTIMATSSVSSKIATVGIVTWSTSLATPTSAEIEFGLTTDYGMKAPVDLKQPDFRTLLLGMKASKTYHYRITTVYGDGPCQSQDYTIKTGAVPNGLPILNITTMDASALAGGFLVVGQSAMNVGATGAPAVILDADGDYVWWYNAGSDAAGVAMDYAGTHMWINKANVPDSGAKVNRVSMDGMTDEDLSAPFSGLSHQLAVLPDETTIFYAYSSSGCEDIKERSPSGTVKTIVNARTAEGGSGACHLNSIQYSPMDDTLMFSDLDSNAITKIKRTGETVWVLNGGASGVTSTFTGDKWLGGEHGIHVLGLDKFLVFNNNSAGRPPGAAGSGDGSLAVEMQLDLTAKTAKKTWSHQGMGTSYQNDILGDVQRVWNGNTMIAFATKGKVREVNAAGVVVQEITWGGGAAIGYIQKRQLAMAARPCLAQQHRTAQRQPDRKRRRCNQRQDQEKQDGRHNEID